MVGLFGRIGITIGALASAILADVFGRKLISSINNHVLLLSFIGLLTFDETDSLYVILFLVGYTDGRIIVGITYFLEFIEVEWKETLLLIRMASSYLFLIIFTFIYQFATRDYQPLAWTLFFIVFFCALYTTFYVPESAEWLSSNRLFLMAKESLKFVANFNGVYEVEGRVYEEFEFLYETKRVTFARVIDRM